MELLIFPSLEHYLTIGKLEVKVFSDSSLAISVELKQFE